MTAERGRPRRTWGLAIPIVAVVAIVGVGVLTRLSTDDEPARLPARQNNLLGIACPSATSCVSVGTMGSAYGVQVPFAVLTDGDAWRAHPPEAVLESGDDVLAAVGCRSPDSCVAVGSHEEPATFFGARSIGERPLAEFWDGSTWRRGRPPIPRGARSGQLNGVGCVPEMCMAVGSYRGTFAGDRALAASWDGASWTPRIPRRVRFGTQLEGVVLEDVSCTSSTSCTAVGYLAYEVPFFPNATGPLIERWDGSDWRPEPAVNPQTTGHVEFSAVACPAPGRCVAVGFRQRRDGTYRPLIEARDRGKWRLQDTPDESGTLVAQLGDVACPQPDHCVAVGSVASRSGPQPFAERWNGTRWTIETVPAPAGSTSSVLTAIGCPRPDLCYVAGISFHGSPIGHAFSARWDGATWTIVPVPAPPGG